MSRHTTLSLDAERAASWLLWRIWHNHGSGQSVQVRVKGRREGNVCGPDEVHLFTTAEDEPVVGTPTGAR